MGAGRPGDGSDIAEDAREIYGDGYPADTTKLVTNIELDAALSMAQTNARRVAQQERHGLADDLLLLYNERAIALATESQQLAAEGRTVAARRKAWQSLAYSSHVHPVTRKNIRDAIVGIIFYLFLTIPFAFFMEKLLVGSNDIRAQIAWQLIIFLIVFGFLRFLHPAYELVRSSYVILLGFLSMALSLMVGVFVTMKFARNVADAYRKSQNRVEAVDVSRMGAAATAFALGLNNLRKRPMRTGLTASTLILITFVMICFTSVRSDVVDVEFPVGEAERTPAC